MFARRRNEAETTPVCAIRAKEYACLRKPRIHCASFVRRIIMAAAAAAMTEQASASCQTSAGVARRDMARR